MQQGQNTITIPDDELSAIGPAHAKKKAKASN